jgi:DNA primase
MRFGPDILDDIRARLPVSQVVGRRVRLRKQGREWVGLSPFNKEKSPSFFVNDQKGFYHDFSSGKHGDVFTFLMETEGLTFPEAVERLAEEAGVRLPAREAPSPAEFAARERRAGAAEALEIAARFFEDELAAASGKTARDYLVRRGLAPDTVREFRLGYAPGGRTALKDHLKALNVPTEAAVEAGLLVSPEDGSAPYDRFRDRVVIPIHDLKGRVVGFGGRALDPDAKPKYLNSPETPLFKKSELLFNAHRAREAAHKESRLVLVEGYMDVIALWQAGFKPVVAALGTAFNEAHIQNLWRLAAEPVICFDGDRAGLGAAHRAIDKILPELKEGRSFWFAFVPEGQDPDDYVRRHGLSAFAELVKVARPASEVMWERELARAPVDTPERMAGFEARLKQAVASIRDPAVKRLYEQHVRSRIGSFFYRLERDRARRPARPGAPAQPRTVEIAKPRDERVLLALCIEYPDLFADAVEKIMSIEFTEALEGLKLELYRILVAVEPHGPDAFYDRVAPQFAGLMDEVHGEADPQRGRSRGWRLKEAHVWLRAEPPRLLIGRLLSLYLDSLELREIEREIARLRDGAEDADRLLALKRAHGDKLVLNEQERTALDEEVRTYRGSSAA